MKSGLFHLVGGDDILCPKCRHTYDVDWDTEYGDPCVGEHFVDCPACGTRIVFGCYIQYTQSNDKTIIGKNEKSEKIS
jgi:DNA-directed RNA polymerase subunit RPC12/RpoP